MNIELARTFLAVLHHQSFSRAAESLHITQTAVTTRMQSLEQQLGCQLMRRDRGGTSLTAQGESFVSYAKQLLQTWERARDEVPRVRQVQSKLNIGTELSLWNPLLLEWLIWLRANIPTATIQAKVELAASLVDKVLLNVMDVAVLHSPQYHPQLKVELLMEETLILVTSTAEQTGKESYVNIDWGPEFSLHHDQTFPELMHSNLSVGLGPLALYYILRAGGSGYFRNRVIQPYLKNGQLVKVANAPEFRYPIYVTIAKDNDDELIEKALAGLRFAMKNDDGPWLV